MALASPPTDVYPALLSRANQPCLNLTYKIKPFSLLVTDNSPEIISSMAFVAGDHLWQFLLYPKGPPQGHLGFGLALYGTRHGSNIPDGHKVYAKFNIYLFNHIKRNFIRIAGNQGSTVLFEGKNLKTPAFPSFNLACLSYQPNGFLTCDQCIFGVEVLVWDNAYQHDCLSTTTIKNPKPFTWEMDFFLKKFSDLQKYGVGESPTFKVENYECKIMYFAPEYPAGTVKNGLLRLDGCPVSSKESITKIEDRFFSLYVCFLPEDLEEDDKCYKHTYVKVLLRIKDQSGREKHVQEEATHWIRKEMIGSPTFIELGVLTNPEKGYLVDDTIIIEAEVTFLASLKRERMNSGAMVVE